MDSATLEQLLANKYGDELDAQIAAFMDAFRETHTTVPLVDAKKPVEELGADDALAMPNVKKRKFTDFIRNTSSWDIFGQFVSRKDTDVQNSDCAEFDYERYGQYISPDYFVHNTADPK